jgi:hypothetical protein
MRKKYRMLKEGETVKTTDQVMMTGRRKWFYGSLNSGKKLPADKVGLYRREIK